MNKIKIVSLLSILTFLFLANLTSASISPNLKVNFDDMNGHAVVKTNEGIKEVIKVKVVNTTGEIRYEISGGIDKELFEFDDNLKILKFKNVPDYENPKDSDLNNIYRVSLKIKDDNVEMRQSFWIHVEDVQYVTSLKKENKKGKRVARNQENCKDSSAINFKNSGKHNQEICIYQADLDRENELNNILLLKKALLEKQSEREKKAVLNENVSAVINKPVSNKVAYINNNTNKNSEKIIENILADTKIKNNELAIESVETKKSQSASVLNSETSFGEKKFPLSFWIFAFLIITAAWLVWKIFRKEEDGIDKL